MAYITITGDSDGDLHTADMHNSKFGAIASVINGNIDLENLTNPNSRGHITFSNSNQNLAATYLELATSTSPNPNASVGDKAAGKFNLLINSIFKAPFPLTITSVNFCILSTSSYVNGENFVLSLQASNGTDPSTATYNTVGVINTDFQAGSSSFSDETPSSLANTSVGQGEYIRLVISQPSTFSGSTQFAGPTSVTIGFKTEHTT